MIRRELRRHHGREVDNAGDGFLMVFESPTDAVRAASAMLAGVHGLGLRIRAGTHTGEVEAAGEKVGGIAVHIAARLLGLAGTEEVLVSSTVRELVVGSGHEFEDRGEHALKGIPGQWHVFALVLPRLDESIAVGAADDEDERRAAERRRRRVVMVAVAGTLVVILVALGGLAVLALRPPPPVTGSGAVVAFGPATDAPLAGWRVGRGPAALAAAAGILWVANIDAGTVVRTDADTGETTTLGQVGPHPSSILLAHDAVWVADRYSDQLTVLAATDGSLVRQVHLHASALAADDRAVWVVDDLRERVLRLDRRTLTEDAVVELPSPSGPTGLAMLDRALWIAAPRADGLLRLDVESEAVSVHPVDLDAITSVDGRGDDLWAASRSTDTVVRVDARTGHVAARVDVCDAPVALAAVEDGAWVACAAEPSPSLWRLNGSGSRLRSISLDAVPAALAVDGDRVWVALRDD